MLTLGFNNGLPRPIKLHDPCRITIISEEFFGGTSKGFWVAPKGDYIVFMESDISTVRSVTM